MKTLGLWVQHLLAQIFIPFTFGVSLFLMHVVMGYRWDDLRAARRQIQGIMNKSKGPFIICPNHLTMVDSLLLVWAMTPFWKALFQPQLFPWNTPEKTNYAHVPILRFFTYIGKCLPVIRSGPEHKTRLLMDKINILMDGKMSLMMFPEGTRSVSGRVDTTNFAYGVGKIIVDLRARGVEPTIILMYLRGHGQVAKSTIPKKHERFYLSSQALNPETTFKGLRATRDISTQLVEGLAAMEARYLTEHPGLVGQGIV